jgi:hypothetical protein
LLTCGCASSSKTTLAPSAPDERPACGCKSKASVGPGPADEPALMAKVRSEIAAAPAAALAETEDAEQRFGNSALAEERRALTIQALINLGQIGAARSRAYQFLERYPNGPYSAHVEAMTGVHLTPTGPGDQKPNR